MLLSQSIIWGCERETDLVVEYRCYTQGQQSLRQMAAQGFKHKPDLAKLEKD